MQHCSEDDEIVSKFGLEYIHHGGYVTSNKVIGVRLASSRSKNKPRLGPHGSSANKNQNPKPLELSDPAAALLTTVVKGDVSQKVVGWMSDGVS